MQTSEDSLDLTGKVALISGGTRGINLEIARHFCSLGAAVTVFGRNPERAESAARSIQEDTGGKVLGLSADVRDKDAVKGVIEATADAFGPLDIVIAGAAGNFLAPAIDVSPNAFRTVVEIDLLGTYHLFHGSFGHLNPAGASLIAITAAQGVKPVPMQVHACAAKAGINMLVQCLAMEWGPAGIRVNAISPGPTADTEGMDRLSGNKEMQDRFSKTVPMRRLGTKLELAKVAAFLSSDAASYITGAIVPCDGGSVHGDASMDCLTSRKREGA